MFLLKKNNNQYYQMKDKNITVEENEKNLFFFTNILNSIEYFVFFGTLLGIVRDKSLIEGDDDIDFYVNIKDKDKLLKILKEENINIDLSLPMNKSGFFLQVYRKINDKTLTIDFYFYETELEKDFIIERWNLEGGTHIPSKHLKIPKNFIYPIKQIIFKSKKIPIPSRELSICEFIYGINWKKKLKKNKDYTIKVINGIPKHYKIKKFLFFKRYIPI